MKPEIEQVVSSDEYARAAVDSARVEGDASRGDPSGGGGWGADLIVMGKLGKRGLSRILLGSVAERVIEFTSLPVLLTTG